MDISAGVDVIEVGRIKKAIERYGEKFLKRIFTGMEMEDCPERDKYIYYTIGFSFKEAVWKALPEKVQNNVYFKDIEILWKNSIPILKTEKFPTGSLLSFSSCSELVITTVILYKSH